MDTTTQTKDKTMTRANINNLIEMYFGTTNPDELETLDEIEDYFDEDNLNSMFGPGCWDSEEAETLRVYLYDRYYKRGQLVS